MTADTKRILITGGGTGGHIFPGIAIAAQCREHGCDVAWMGAEKGLEKKLVPKHGIPLFVLPVVGFRGKSLFKKCVAPFLLLRSLIKAYRIIRQFKPNIIIAVGGFACFPGGLMAKLLGIPLVLHEQNAVPGSANKILARFASKICVGFPKAFQHHPNAVLVGNPVRQTIAAFSKRVFGETPKHVLVLGGSQGAQAINRLIPPILALFPRENRPEVWHQTGDTHWEEMQVLYAEYQIEARVDPFIDDMAKAYAWADLAITRAGASTVSELACTTLPAILIPLPTAIDDHQTLNAHFLTGSGAAIALKQNEVSPEVLHELVGKLLSDPKALKRMADAADRVAIRDTASRVCEILLKGI